MARKNRSPGYSLLSAQGLSTGWANGIALAVSILFAYFTNRRWVFLSRAHGRAALREFGSFILCRIGTGLIDQAIMLIGVDRIGASLFPSPGLGLSIVKHIAALHQASIDIDSELGQGTQITVIFPAEPE